MSYKIKDLLSLPAEEKIAIADLLYSSVDDEFDENQKLIPWYQNEEFISAIEKEFKDWEEGKIKGYTLEEVKNLMEEHKANYKPK
jgi:hypothetical protein